MILVDTDVLLDALRGAEPAKSLLARGIVEGELATTAVTAFELHAGARDATEARGIDSLLASLTVWPIDLAAARIAGAIERDLRRRGLRIGEADALMAGACLATDASLWTRNRRHFARVAGLRLVDEP